MYRLIISKQADKYIKKQDSPTIRRLIAAIDSLAENPRSIGESLANHEAEYKIRVGKFRILYNVYDVEIVVIVIIVIRVYNRGDVYKK